MSSRRAQYCPGCTYTLAACSPQSRQSEEAHGAIEASQVHGWGRRGDGLRVPERQVAAVSSPGGAPVYRASQPSTLGPYDVVLQASPFAKSAFAHAGCRAVADAILGVPRGLGELGIEREAQP